MARRKPVPALVFLLALTLLTSLVWWRVVNRTTESDAKSPSGNTCTQSSSAGPTILPAPATVTVHVYNATTRNGLAAQVRDGLVAAGFKVADINTATKQLATVGEIRYGAQSEKAAQSLSFRVPGATLVNTNRAGTDIELDLGAKYTRLATNAEVTAAMSQARVTFQAAGASTAATSC